MASTHGLLLSINTSSGGVPKLPRHEASIAVGGVDGDRQRNLVHHGGVDRAVSLYSFDLIRALQREGHTPSIGVLGENLTTVAVKRGLSRFSARNIPPVRARQMIEEGAFQALQNISAVKPYVPTKPTKITVELTSADKAADFMGRHGVTIEDTQLKVVSEGDNWMQAWDQVWHW